MRPQPSPEAGPNQPSTPAPSSQVDIPAHDTRSPSTEYGGSPFFTHPPIQELDEAISSCLGFLSADYPPSAGGQSASDGESTERFSRPVSIRANVAWCEKSIVNEIDSAMNRVNRLQRTFVKVQKKNELGSGESRDWIVFHQGSVFHGGSNPRD